jgi:hypothetical protein
MAAFLILITFMLMTALWIIVGTLLVVAMVTVELNGWARRAGYAIPGRTPVRCSQGHLFLTTWVMGGSLTKVRLSPLTRWGRCPVGRHWATMHPVTDDELADEERTTLYGEAQQ